MDIVKHFDKLTGRYDKYSALANNLSIEKELTENFKNLNSSFVLDVATGTGNFGKIFLGKGANVTGIDINKKMLLEAQNKGMSTVLGTAFDLPFSNDAFDLVTCRQFLQYNHPNLMSSALSEMHRVLKTNGNIVLHQIASPDKIYSKSLTEFMTVEGNPCYFLCCDELEEIVTKANFKVAQVQLQKFPVKETRSDFCGVRNIDNESIDKRVKNLLGIDEFQLSENNDEITYIRHYSLLVAKKNG
ncbi:MAG: class I SAM-dependent methyltransferase [Chloroflexi bacterium]|nr:class I SAM-dependent methyltransferase [Chloroflexota bacterium]